MRKLGIALAATLALSALLGTSAGAHIPVDAPTHAIAINHTTGLAYVGAGADCICGGSVVVINTAADTVVATIPTARRVTEIAVDEERNQIFAAHLDTGTISVIDGATNAVSETPLPFGGRGLAVNPVRDLLYAVLVTGGMAIYDLTTTPTPAYVRTVPATPLGADWWGVAVNPVTDRIYIANRFGAVEVLDGATDTLVTDISIFGEARSGITVDVGANLVYVARHVSNGRVHVIDGATNPPTLRSVFATTGSSPRSIALDVAAERLYSADFGSGTVTVSSTAGTLPRIEMISVGGQPTGVALPTRGPKRLYVTNASLGNVTVISLATNRPPAMVSATIAPTSPDTDDVLTATAVAQDPDSDPLTYSYQWTKGGIDILGATGATLDLRVSGNGDRGNEIAVRVTANDGRATSEPLTSASVTVINSAPTMISATIAPTAPDTDDVLTATAVAQDLDVDPLTYSYQWTKNGADIAGATGETLDLGVSGNGDGGHEIAVRVTANDGTADSDPLTSASVTVNAPPVIISATIAPTSPDTDDVLTATAVAQDPDGDPLTYSYQWTKNGADISGATRETLDLGVGGNGDRGDAIAVRVTASDGRTTSAPLTSASVTVVNAPPVMISATIVPTSPDTDDELTTTAVAQDLDGDPIEYSYQWTKNGTDLAEAIGATLNLGVSGNGDRGDAIAVRVTANDDDATSEPLTSASVTVVNAPPVMISATISPKSPDTNDVLTATGVAQDPDGDVPDYSYQWTKNGTDIAGAIGQTLDLAVSGNGDRGDVIAVRVTARDGSATSAPLTSATVTVINRAPSMIDATIAPTSPDTLDMLTATVAAQDLDGDPLEYSYQWTRGGADIAEATGQTLDLAVSGNGDHGDAIAVRVTARDGSATSAPLTSASVTVINSAPSMIAATIAPTSPDTDDVLTATAVAQDLDSDPLEYSYQWTKNGTPIAGAIGKTLDLAVSGNGDHGDEIAVRVTANDGTADSEPLTSASVTVNRGPSMISVTIAPTSPDTDDVLTATAVAQDPEGDPITYSYQWTKGGAVIPGATGRTLDLGISGNGDRDEAIAVRVTANDGRATSEPLTSASVTVVNSAPSVSVTLTPIRPSHKDVVTAHVTVSDADLDTVTLTYVWRVDGQVRPGTTNVFDLSLPHNGTPHDTVTVTVTPNDGTTDGAAVTATAIVLPGN